MLLHHHHHPNTTKAHSTSSTSSSLFPIVQPNRSYTASSARIQHASNAGLVCCLTHGFVMTGFSLFFPFIVSLSL
ncbi:hypothetical protein M440DRAFT_1250606 [Trichoderma longibrachiatum ATCC 18648]|uniref:Uncharacterized protein n=1 Tax=Trichoderma longibrachiatum ATCC 18648 TaxID=983965 RepID=A0A2T4C450_TRILO|nr:hypothetical protein M440DRAFT_1250606 [Trichoderma longibrachiatum ATCC 18648]